MARIEVNRWRWIFALAALAVATGLAAKPLPPIQVGVTASFSGEQGPLGRSLRNGVRLAVREINLVGGVRGRKIELIERDDRGNEERGAAIAESLGKRDGVVAAIGLVDNRVALASIDRYQQAKLPLLVASAAHPSLTKEFARSNASQNYIFRVAPSLEAETFALAATLHKRGLHKVALLVSKAIPPAVVVEAMQAAAQAKQIELVLVQDFEARRSVMDGGLKQAQEAQAQAVVVWGSGSEIAALARRRLVLGWQVPLFGSGALTDLEDKGLTDMQGLFVAHTYLQGSGSQVKNGFVAAYESMFKQAGLASPMAAAQGYDAMYLLAAALRQAGSLEGADVKDALENLKTQVNGVVTTYRKPFSQSDHEAMHMDLVFVGELKNGAVLPTQNGADVSHSEN